MHAIIAAFAIALATPAWAQPASNTHPLINSNTGEKTGTVTIVGKNRYIIRNLKEEFLATIVVEADGSRSVYDENGQAVKRPDPK